MEYFVVKNWKKFQQYRDRKPDWIKLHMDLLDDYEFSRMPEADQLHLVKIWLLFAKENPPTSDTLVPLPVDHRFITGRVAARKSVRLDRLLKTSFLELHTDTHPNCTGLYETRPTEIYKEYKPYKPEKENPPLPPFQKWFDAVWDSYPNKIGKKEAYRHFKATVTTDTHLKQIWTALDNYKEQVEYDRTRMDGYQRQYQNGGTWFNNWQDWLEHKVEKINPPPKQPKKTTFENKRDAADKWLEESKANDQRRISSGTENILELRGDEPGQRDTGSVVPDASERSP